MHTIREIIKLLEAIEVPPEPEHILAPDIGARFKYHNHTFMVSGWLKEAPRRDTSWLDSEDGEISDDWMGDILYHAQQEIGPRKQKLVWCVRKDATHVSGKGVSGCVVPVDMIRIVGRVPIDKAYYDSMLRSQMRRIGLPV